jgi:archaellum component FlaC
MNEKSLFIKLEKHNEVKELIKKIENTKTKTKNNLELMKEIIAKEKNILENFEDSIKRIELNLEDVNNLLNTE